MATARSIAPLQQSRCGGSGPWRATRKIPLAKTNRDTENRPGPQRKCHFSNHQFSGVNSLSGFRQHTFSKSVMEFTTEFTCFDQCLLLWGVEGSMQNHRINHRAFTTRKGVDATTAKANVFARIWDVLGTYLRFKRGLPWEQDWKNKSTVLRFQKRNQQRFPSLQVIDIPGATFPLPNIL